MHADPKSAKASKAAYCTFRICAHTSCAYIMLMKLTLDRTWLVERLRDLRRRFSINDNDDDDDEFVWRDEIMFAFSQQTKIMVEDLFCWCNNVTETPKRNRVRCRHQANEFKTLVFSVTNILYLPSTGGNPINEFSLQFLHHLNLDHNNAAIKLS